MTTLRAMLCSLRHRLGRFENRLSKNCTAVVTMIGASQFSVANRKRSPACSALSPPAAVLQPLERLVLAKGAVMLDHLICKFWPQCLAEYACRLLDDAREWNDIDDAIETVRDGMVKGEGEGRECLAAAGRHRQRKQTGIA